MPISYNTNHFRVFFRAYVPFHWCQGLPEIRSAATWIFSSDFSLSNNLRNLNIPELFFLCRIFSVHLPAIHWPVQLFLFYMTHTYHSLRSACRFCFIVAEDEMCYILQNTRQRGIFCCQSECRTELLRNRIPISSLSASNLLDIPTPRYNV